MTRIRFQGSADTLRTLSAAPALPCPSSVVLELYTVSADSGASDR